MESGCSKEKRKRQTKSEVHVKEVSLPRLRRGSSGSRALPGWEAGLGAEDREGKGGSLLTGCRDKKNGGCLLPRCLLSARNRAGRAAAPAAETLSPGGQRRGRREGRTARAARTAGGGDGALRAAWAAAAAAKPSLGAGCPPPSGGGSSPVSAPPAAPSPPGHPSAIAPGRGSRAGLGTCCLWMPKKERRARKMQTHRWKDEGVGRFRV